METLVFKYPFPVTLTENLKENKIFSLIGFYGDSKTLSLALLDYLGQKLKIDSGFSLLLNKHKKKSALVYSSGDEIIGESQSCDKIFLAYLISICEEIVACFSGNIVKKWYFEDSAKLRGHFKKGFELIHTHSKNSLEMKLEAKNCINFNLNLMKISLNFAYKIKESLKPPNNSTSIKDLASKFVLKLFKSHSNPTKVKPKFIKFLNQIDDMISCKPETTKSLFESLHHLFMKLSSSIPEIYHKACESIKKELFCKNQKLTQTAEILNFSLIDYFLEQILKNSKKPNQINQIFHESVISKLPQDQKKFALKTFNYFFNLAYKEINLIEAEIISSAIEKISILENFRIVQSLEITEFEVKKMIKGQVEDGLRNFFISFSNQVGKLMSLERLTGRSLACLFGDEEGKGTSLVLLTEEGKYLHFFLKRRDYVVVKGCDEECLVLLDNERFVLYLFEVAGEELVKKGVKRFSGCVRCPWYLKISKEIVFIGDDEKLALCGLGLDDQARYYNLSPFAINTYCTDEKFEYIFLSDDNKILGLVLRSSLILIHRDYDLILKSPLEKRNFLSAFIYHSNETYFLVILYPSLNLHYKLSFSQSSHPHSFQNSILDIVEDSYHLIHNKPSIICKSLSVFIEPGYELSQSSLFTYFSLLTSINSSINLKKNFFNPNESNHSISLNYLSENLFKFSYFKLVKIFPFELKNSLNDSSYDEKVPIVIQLKNIQNFEFFESKMIEIGEVYVVSVIASRWEDIEKVLQDVFNVLPFKQSYNEICVRPARVKDRDFVVVTWVLSHVKVDSNVVKAYEVATALADRVILPMRLEDMEDVSRVVNEICFAKGRIGGDRLFSYELELVVLDSESNAPITIQEYIKTLPIQASIFFLTPPTSSTYLARHLLYKSKLTSKPTRSSGPELIENIKLLLSQVLTRDNHSLEYWASWPQSPTPNHKLFLCQESPGICDHKVIKTNLGFSIIPFKLAKNHSNFHYCKEKCFKCGAYCQLEYSHFGYHSTKQHFNCDINYFINKKLSINNSLSSFHKTHSLWNEKLWESPFQSIFGFN